MIWIKARVKTTQFGAEVVTAVLMENNIAGAEIIDAKERIRNLTASSGEWDYAEAELFVDSEDVYVIFYVTDDSQGKKLLDDIGAELSRQSDLLGIQLQVDVETADDKLWLNEWKKHFKPFKIGGITIVPEWEKYDSSGNEIVFTIDPGSAFGTGQHQTTRLSILALQENLKKGDRLLDIGCGSGILSIIGLLLGAGEVLACDIDPAGAIAATNKNARLNPVDISRLKILSGDALSDEKLRNEICAKEYNVVVANIVADVIIELVPFVKGILAQNGVFIASGIIDERAEEVSAVFEKNNFECTEIKLEGWFCFVGKIKDIF
ncbi:MAG: 50S ribosomal protein L11 methyltransferase [Defluviitaleaceae bacterium]|nr:50S ribosomal protein L11 methyltransferase [Defluviitaleaceae bacterium]